jgi:sterol desaturase/sphingolipid hydroxylase (fatty acid hydroxylase superfamily)
MNNTFPTPLEILLDPISLTILGMFAGLALWEAVAPARQLPVIKGWRFRGLISYAVYFFLSSYLPMITDGYLIPYQLIDLTGLGTIGGAIAGVFVLELGTWLWHRAMHASDLLWHGFHQMHHSAERLDIYGANYFSLADMAGWTVLGSVCLVLGIGLTPEAATLTLLTVSFMAMLSHANVNTPRWLGYITVRPESHSVHHERDRHRNNYCELPVIDMLFGTFVNPGTFVDKTGFYDGASARVLDMHLFRDVSRPAVMRAGKGPGTRGMEKSAQQSA